MKKTLMVFACTALLAASLSACGSKPAENTDTGTASSAAASSSSSEQQQENTLTGSLDEKKNGMFVVTDAEGAAWKERKKSPAGDRFSVSPAGDFVFQDFCSALSRYIR